MADVMIEGGSSENGHPAAAELSRGLGVLKHALTEQHFDARSGRIERLAGLLRDHRRLANFSPTSRPKEMIALALEEETALVVQGNRLRVAGKKLAHVFVQVNCEPKRKHPPFSRFKNQKSKIVTHQSFGSRLISTPPLPSSVPRRGRGIGRR